MEHLSFEVTFNYKKIVTKACSQLEGYFAEHQIKPFQIPWITYFWFCAQKSWETISNNFLVLCKMGTHAL